MVTIENDDVVLYKQVRHQESRRESGDEYHRDGEENHSHAEMDL